MSDQRLRKSPDEARQDRAEENRQVTQNRAISDDDRLEIYRSQFQQAALPDLPEIDGYHTCWLTTTNPRDSIHLRTRLGYEPIKASDVPGFEYYSLKTGEYAGLIGVNEMLAFKLPLTLYERYMNESHAIAPFREQEKITSLIDSMRDQAQQQGANILEGDGFSELRQSPRPANWA
jgi:hypothetical protein